MKKIDFKELRARMDEQNPEHVGAFTAIDVIGELIALRFRAGLTQTEIAARIGVPQPRVAQFEAMDGRRVSLEFAGKYAQALGASIKVVAPKRASKGRATESRVRQSSGAHEKAATIAAKAR